MATTLGVKRHGSRSIFPPFTSTALAAVPPGYLTHLLGVSKLGAEGGVFSIWNLLCVSQLGQMGVIRRSNMSTTSICFSDVVVVCSCFPPHKHVLFPISLLFHVFVVVVFNVVVCSAWFSSRWWPKCAKISSLQEQCFLGQFPRRNHGSEGTWWCHPGDVNVGLKTPWILLL